MASGVPGLKIESVRIEDTNGTDYTNLGSAGTGAAATSALKLQLERQLRDRYREQILAALGPIYGEKNISATVNVEVELGDKTINDYQVTLPEFAENGETGGRGPLEREFYTYQFVTDDDSAVGGVVGTTTNSDLPMTVEPGDAQAQLQGILEEQVERNYDNSKTQTHMIITAGRVTNVTATVGINSRTAGEVNLGLIRSGVASAIGIVAPLELPDNLTADEYMARYITVINDAFPEEPVVEPPATGLDALGIPMWVVFAAGGGLLLFAIILTVILLLRGRKRKKERAEQQAVEELLAVAMPQMQQQEDGSPAGEPVGADVMNLHTERSMELRQDIRDFVDENMEVAALLIKSWLKEGGENA